MIECSLSRLNSRQSKEGCEETFLKYVLYAFGNIHVDSNRDGLILFATSVSGAIHVAGEHGLFLVSYDIVIHFVSQAIWTQAVQLRTCGPQVVPLRLRC